MSASWHINQLKRLLTIEERTRLLKARFSTANVSVAAEFMDQTGRMVGGIVRFLVGAVDEPSQSARIEPAVVATITRVFIEQHETFAYLCFDKISECEREFRRFVYYLHQEVEKSQIVHHLPKFPSPHENIFRTDMAPVYRWTLKQNSFFQSLGARAQASILSGKSAFYNSSSGGHGRGISRDQEISALYKLFSNVVHGTSLGSYAVRTTKHRSQIDGHNLVALALSCSVRLFARSINSYTKLRPRLRAALSLDERKWLIAITQYPLEMWPRLSNDPVDRDTFAPW